MKKIYITCYLHSHNWREVITYLLNNKMDEDLYIQHIKISFAPLRSVDFTQFVPRIFGHINEDEFLIIKLQYPELHRELYL